MHKKSWLIGYVIKGFHVCTYCIIHFKVIPSIADFLKHSVEQCYWNMHKFCIFWAREKGLLPGLHSVCFRCENKSCAWGLQCHFCTNKFDI